MKWLRLALLLLMIGASARQLLVTSAKRPFLTPHEQLFTEFDENIKAGNLVPVWAQHLNHGLGEARLEFLPPLPEYVTEAFYSITHNAARALACTGVFLILLAGSGMFLLACRLSEEMACLSAGAYVLNPWFLKVACQDADYKNLSALALLPWLALTILQLVRDGRQRAFPRAALLFAALAASNTTLALLALPFIAVAAWVYHGQLRNRTLLLAALVTGSAAAAFHWAPSFGERHFDKTIVLSAAGPFVPLLALLAAGGTLVVLGLTWGLLRWSGSSPTLAWHRGSQAFWKLSLTLLVFTLVAGYFTHHLSAVWHAALPDTATSTAFMPLFVFFGTLLGTAALAKECTELWQWTGMAMIVFAASAGAVHVPLPRAEAIPEAISHNGPESILNFVQGRGEGKCDRNGPTRVDCEIMAVHNSMIRFNVFDYPNWHALVDGKPSLATGPDGIHGTLLMSLAPGKHVVHWRLRDTRLRLLSKWLSVLALLGLVALLFKNELSKRKPLAPQSI
ncbi:MAG: hypothetical protein HY074_08815 [Deltaproteobacteria bacterium]|nr:hypothetical protein [Deltaproteobacteria bacterium]